MHLRKKFDSSKENIYFTSDLHIGHSLFIKKHLRPHKTVEEMNECLFDLLGSFHDDDIIFYLGDFVWHKRFLPIAHKYMKGTWYFIKGNHDSSQDIKHEFNLQFMPDIMEITIDTQPITLCHYPMISWNRSHYGAWQLYGHHHRDTTDPLDSLFGGKKFNVAYDANDFQVVPYSKVKHYMNEAPDNWDTIEYHQK